MSRPAPDDTVPVSTHIVSRNGHGWRVIDHPAAQDGMASFCNGAEEATLSFFDAVLPQCHRMVDFGTFIGLMSLYAAGFVAEVHSVEASPTHLGLLRRNLDLNPSLAARIRVHPCAVGDADGEAILYRKGPSDSGASLFQDIERQQVFRGHPEARVKVRDAAALLRETGLDRRTLLKIDIEGMEYSVLQRLASLLAQHQPFLQVSFHPFNIVRQDAYLTQIARLRAALEAAEVCAAYPYMYLYQPDRQGGGRWVSFSPADRLSFLHLYLLVAKPAERIATPLFGFVDAVGFSATELPLAD